MKRKMQILHIVYILVMCAILVVVMVTTLPSKLPQGVREFLVTVRIVRIPTEEDVQRLQKCYEEVSDYLADNSLTKDEILELQTSVEAAVTCSRTNKNFNFLADKYGEYQQRLTEIQMQIEKFEKEYLRYQKLLEAVPDFAPGILAEKQEEYDTVIVPLHEDIKQVEESYLKDEAEVEEVYLACKQLADYLFNLYYDPLCHIVNAEAGNCPTIEMCYVANVIENRILSPRFPNTPLDVIFAENQYSPTWNGSYYNTPSKLVRQTMEDYLRGRIDTEMPENVLYQALFPQGENWKHMPSGHYFDYG